MDAELEQMIRETLAGEPFGVLATMASGRLHTATILFAETPDFETVHAIRPPTLKAQLSYITPRVAFQVDNRAVNETDRTRFVRIGMEGTLRHVPRDHGHWPYYRDIFAAKLPFGAALLDSPEIELHVLTPAMLRVAVGARPPEDIDVPTPRLPVLAEDGAEVRAGAVLGQDRHDRE